MHSSILIMVYYDILSNLQCFFSCHHLPFYGFLHQYLRNFEYVHFMVKIAGDSCSSSLGLIQRSICWSFEPIGFHPYIAGGKFFCSALCYKFSLISCYVGFLLSSLHSTRCGIGELYSREDFTELLSEDFGSSLSETLVGQWKQVILATWVSVSHFTRCWNTQFLCCVNWLSSYWC